jgi:hypothetical protein
LGVVADRQLATEKLAGIICKQKLIARISDLEVRPGPSGESEASEKKESENDHEHLRGCSRNDVKIDDVMLSLSLRSHCNCRQCL